MHKKARYRYIGLIGLPGSGKDECSRYLINEYSMGLVTLSDIVKEEVIRRGLPVTRKNLQMVGMDLRSRFGKGVIAERAVEKVKSMEERDTYAGFVLNGLRNVEELRVFWDNFTDGCIIAIWASRKTRFNRILRRKRKGFDSTSYAEFLEEDWREIELFGLGNSMVWADFLIVNEGGLEDLHKSIDDIIS